VVVVLAQKNKSFETELEKWNEVVFGNFKMRKKAFLVGLHDLDAIVEEGFLSDEETTRKAEITSDLERTTLLEVRSWR
jgi:hypothetical protein